MLINSSSVFIFTQAGKEKLFHETQSLKIQPEDLAMFTISHQRAKNVYVDLNKFVICNHPVGMNCLNQAK